MLLPKFVSKKPADTPRQEHQSTSRLPTQEDCRLTRIVIAHCSKLLAETAGSNRQAFIIKGTENVGVLDLTESRYPADEWRIRISAVRKGTDWMASNYLWTGSRDEVVCQMQAEAGQEEILNAVLALSDRVDQHWDE